MASSVTAPELLTQDSVRNHDVPGAADFLMSCFNGSPAKASGFLLDVLSHIRATSGVQATLQAGASRSRTGVAASQEGLHMPLVPREVQPVPLVGDDVDGRLSTLILLVPGKPHIIGHLIGKGGADIVRIEREAGVTVKIESQDRMPKGSTERRVCVIGPVANNVLGQQLISLKLQEKLMEDGVQQEVLKMVVPNEIVPRLIGTRGAHINKLQAESQTRIQIEQESSMQPGALGRAVALQGSQSARSYAQYLISRRIAEDMGVPAEWSGRVSLPVQFPLGSGNGNGEEDGAPSNRRGGRRGHKQYSRDAHSGGYRSTSRPDMGSAALTSLPARDQDWAYVEPGSVPLVPQQHASAPVPVVNNQHHVHASYFDATMSSMPHMTATSVTRPGDLAWLSAQVVDAAQQLGADTRPAAQGGNELPNLSGGLPMMSSGTWNTTSQPLPW